MPGFASWAPNYLASELISRVTEQANDFLKHVKKTKLPAEALMQNRDCKYTVSFDKALWKGDLRVSSTSAESGQT